MNMYIHVKGFYQGKYLEVSNGAVPGKIPIIGNHVCIFSTNSSTKTVGEWSRSCGK